VNRLIALIVRFATNIWIWARQNKLKAIFSIILLYCAGELLTIPYLDIALLKTKNPSETALMRQRIVEAGDIGKSLKISQRWIPLSRIPRHTVNAIIAAEDGMFHAHRGIDWFEVHESIERNLDEGRAARGASTITQQLAKNLYLSTSKTPMRKLKEVIITILLERHLEKARILELYVNLIEWGRGIFGIESASRTYFGKSASQLTLEESARLAAVIPSPLKHRPDADSRYVLRRKKMVLARMSSREKPSSPGQVPDSALPTFSREPAAIDTITLQNTADSIDE